MFRIFGVMCLLINGETTCNTHYRSDFKTWTLHTRLCMPHTEATLEETINTLKITGMEYTTLQVVVNLSQKNKYKKNNRYLKIMIQYDFYST